MSHNSIVLATDLIHRTTEAAGVAVAAIIPTGTIVLANGGVSEVAVMAFKRLP